MQVRDVGDDDPLLRLLYADVLVPSFADDELESFDWLRNGLARGTAVVGAVTDDEGLPLGAAVGGWSPESRVLLLAYLAVRPGRRSGGVGALLMDQVTRAWQVRFRPALTLAEIAHPLAHEADESHGDPAARLRFYARHGARALDIPYFQPALRPDSDRVYGMLLVVLAQAPGSAGGQAGTVRPGLVRAFLSDYLLHTEGAEVSDPALNDVRRAVAGAGGIRLLSLDRPAELPLALSF